MGRQVAYWIVALLLAVPAWGQTEIPGDKVFVDVPATGGTEKNLQQAIDDGDLGGGGGGGSPGGSTGQVQTNAGGGNFGAVADGTTGQVLTFTTPGSPPTYQAPASGVPSGGTTGQIIEKQSGAEGDADWVDHTAPTHATDHQSGGTDQVDVENLGTALPAGDSVVSDGAKLVGATFCQDDGTNCPSLPETDPVYSASPAALVTNAGSGEIIAVDERNAIGTMLYQWYTSGPADNSSKCMFVRGTMANNGIPSMSNCSQINVGWHSQYLPVDSLVIGGECQLTATSNDPGDALTLNLSTYNTGLGGWTIQATEANIFTGTSAVGDRAPFTFDYTVDNTTSGHVIINLSRTEGGTLGFTGTISCWMRVRLG